MNYLSGADRAYSASHSNMLNRSCPEVSETTYDVWQDARNVSNVNQRQYEFESEFLDIPNDEWKNARNANNENEQRDEEILQTTHDEWYKANVSKVKGKQRQASPETYEITSGLRQKNVREKNKKQNEDYPGSLASIYQELRDLQSYMSDETDVQALPATNEEWAILQKQVGQWSLSQN